MQLGNLEFAHNNMMNFTNKTFELYFEKKIKLQKFDYSNNAMGWFILEYVYLVRGYKIIFEHDRLSFSIKITDFDGSHTSLSKMVQDKKINTNLEKHNIESAVKILCNEIKRDDICFYITKGDKHYKKLDGELIRIKYPFMK